MKILFVCENYLPHIGGVEIVFKNLAENLVENGHEVILVTHQLKGTKKVEMINGVKVYRVPCFDNRYLFTFLSVPKVFQLAKNADIIQTTTFNGAPPAWLVSKLRKKPCLITVHEVWIGKWKQITELRGFKAWLHDLLERMIYVLDYCKYVCVSQSTQNQLLDLGTNQKKTIVIYNGVNYNHWNPQRYDREKIRKKLDLQNNFVYLFNGRPGISKGLEYLLKAVPVISKSIPNSKLLAIVSKDPAYKDNYNKVIKLIKQLKIEDKVILHDPVPYRELPNYIKAADCIVIPSLAEGFGFAAAESCAMGKPVVVSNTASLPEIVSGKFVLVEPKDHLSIAEGVEKVFKKNYTQTKLKKFKIKDNVDNYIKTYQELLKKLSQK